MGYTVTVADTEAVEVTDVAVETRPGTIAFAVEGTIAPSAGLLGSLAGSRFAPETVTFAVDGETVSVDLGEDAELRLESVDVDVETPDVEVSSMDPSDAEVPGVEPSDVKDVEPSDVKDPGAPDADDVDLPGTDDGGVPTPETDDVGVPGADDVRSAAPDDVPTPDAATLSFSVEGVIDGVDADVTDELAQHRDVSITAVEYGADPFASDGGEREPDVRLAIRLLGFGITVWSDGAIDLGRRSSPGTS